jgi:hypothetical protein
MSQLQSPNPQSNMNNSQMNNLELSASQINYGNLQKPVDLNNNDLSNSCPNPAS